MFVYATNYFEYDNGQADSLLGISNWRSWKKEFEDEEGKTWWHARGPTVLALKHHKGSETREYEAIQGLEGYPVFDESDHSELEMETQTKDWDEWGRDDLRRDIIRNANTPEHDRIEALIDGISDEKLDEIVHAIWEADGHYPEIEGTSTRFPEIITHWDGTMVQLGEILALANYEYVVEVELSPAAYDKNNRVVLRPQDLPEEVRDLVSSSEPIEMKYDQRMCDSPYLTCVWTPRTEIENRKAQIRLPGMEKRRSHARRHVG